MNRIILNANLESPSSTTMRCHPKRIVTSAFICSVLYFVVDYIFYPQDYQPVEQPLENMRFNQIQVRESNLVMAVGPRPLRVPDEEKQNFHFRLPVGQNKEAPHVKVIRNQLRALNNKTTAHDDPKLIRTIQDHWIREPSYKVYQLDEPYRSDFSMGQSQIVDRVLNEKRGGFFVECGGLDGETRSNSLFFERERNWDGLLIEAGPLNYRKLIAKNRRAYATPSCLSTQPYPNVMYFHRGRNRGRLINNDEAFDWVLRQKMTMWLMEVQCFPLYSLLLALNRTHIDYFSLDVEGVELDVLKTIPFDKIYISVLTVEFAHGREGKQALEKFMSSKGYEVVGDVIREDHLAYDLVFKKRDFKVHME